MRSEILAQEKNVVSIRVEFDADEFRQSIDKAVQKIAQNVSVPGFRKGMIPRRIIEMRFGRPAILSEALDDMLPHAIDQIISEYELDIIDSPKVSVETMEEGKPLSVSLQFDVTPEVQTPELGEITVVKSIPSVTDEMVQNTIDDIRRQNMDLVIVDDRNGSEHDVIDIDYVTTVFSKEGTEEKRHESAPASVDLEAQNLRKEIREALIGVKPGVTSIANVSIEDDYADKDLAGKTVRYDMTVKAVKEKRLPEMSQDFFKAALGEDIPDEAAFHQEIRNRLVQRIEAEAQNKAETEAVDAVSEKSVLEVPASLVEKQLAAMKEQDEETLKKKYNRSISEFLEEAALSKDEYEANMRSQAEKIVRRTLVLDEIAKQLEIKVDKEEMESEISSLAVMYRVPSEQIKRTLFKDKEKLSDLLSRIRYRKTVEAVMKKVNVTENTSVVETAPGRLSAGTDNQ